MSKTATAKTKRPPKTVVISRAKWATADNREERDYRSTMLRTDDGMQCCLGFVCRAFGSKASECLDVGFPSSLTRPLARLAFMSDLDEVTGCDFEELAAGINDDHDLDRRERERKLKELFRGTPVRLKFVP